MDASARSGGPVASDIGLLHRVLLGVAGLLVVIVGAAAILGWESITRIRPEWPVIYPYTVIGLACLVIAMILFDRGGRSGQYIGRALTVIPLVFGIVIEPAISLGWLPSNDPAAAQMSLATVLPAVAVVATALCVFLLGFPADRAPRTRFALGSFAGVVALLGLLSYVYGSNALFQALGLTGTSLPTTVIGLIVIGAALSARPDRPPLEALDRQYDSQLLRRILPVVVVVPFVPAIIGWFSSVFVTDSKAAVAVAQLATVVVLLTVIVVLSAGQSRSRRSLTTERQRLWQAFASTPSATAMLDADGRIMLANSTLERLLGRDGAAVLGQRLFDFVVAEDQPAVREALLRISHGADVVRLDVRVTPSGGGAIWVDAGLAAVHDVNGRVAEIVVQMTDLTDRKNLETVLSDQALRDPLTGLLNREGLGREISQRALYVPEGHVPAVVYADVDNLKVINDSVGHAAGDDLLREVARRLQASTREEDVIARVGGDEFVVITATRDAGSEPAAVVVSRLRDELAGPVAVGREIVTMSVSLGAALVLDGDVAAALVRADEAMYEDKRRRRSSSRMP